MTKICLELNPMASKLKQVNMNKSDSAIELRNEYWAESEYIPSWVDTSEVGLDQFFTRPEVAQMCWESLQQHMKSNGSQLKEYKFIEPSAGLGAFFNLLPTDRRIGIDVEKFNSKYIQKDFLSWKPNKSKFNFACVGNPPFGYRAWLALAFMNHAAQFCDYVGFIVPMAFQSRGKSNVQDRVEGLTLIHSSPLPKDSFVSSTGKALHVNALWQIWAKNSKTKVTTLPTCNQYIDLFTVDMRKERACGHARLHEADYFLQRTFYKQPPSLVTSFDQVKYVCGYGIVIKKKRREVLKALRNADWTKHSNLASHNCKHISMCHIRAALTESGLIDDL